MPEASGFIKRWEGSQKPEPGRFREYVGEEKAFPVLQQMSGVCGMDVMKPRDQVRPHQCQRYRL